MLSAVFPRKLQVSVCALALAGLLVACSSPSPKAAATVGGTEIPDSAVQALIPPARVLFAGSQTPCAEGGSDADCGRFLLSALIQAAAVKGYAEDNKVTPTSTVLNDTLNQVQTGSGGADAMRQSLADNGGTMDDMRELIRMLLVLSAVQDRVTTNFSQADFEANKDQYATIDTAHILVKDQAQAQKIADEATTANFADLAKKYSEDPGSGKQGGDLGPIPASGLVPEYSQAVLGAQPGDIIGPVQSQFGWHVIWVKDITYPTYEEAKAQAAQSGSNASAFQPWMEKVLNDSGVEVNPRYGTFDASTGQVAAPAGSQKPSPSGQAPPPSP
jgi:hypothetical protein